MNNQNNTNKPFYHFDINTTTKCNLRCTYCIEHDWFIKPEEKQTPEKMEKIVEKIDAMLQSDRFISKHGGIKVNFWGGEPTINPQFIKNMLARYADENRVGFFIYSNGYNIGNIIPLLEENKFKKTSNGQPKIHIQVSYDGEASHNVARLNVKGEGSAKTVKETLTILRDKGLSYDTKATIGFMELDKLYENYKEHRRMSEEGYNVSAYGPTIDYLSDYEFDPVEMQGFKDTLKSQIFKMAKEEIDFYKKNGRFFFHWLNDQHALCSAGEMISLIDTNGEVLVCHGAIYEENRDDHKLADISQDNEEFINNLMDAAEKYHEARVEKPLPIPCQSCHTHYCMKCNVKKASVSEEDDYFDKWTDYTDQDHLCQLFKHLGTLRLAIMKIINNQKG